MAGPSAQPAVVVGGGPGKQPAPRAGRGIHRRQLIIPAPGDGCRPVRAVLVEHDQPDGREARGRRAGRTAVRTPRVRLRVRDGHLATGGQQVAGGHPLLPVGAARRGQVILRASGRAAGLPPAAQRFSPAPLSALRRSGPALLPGQQFPVRHSWFPAARSSSCACSCTASTRGTSGPPCWPWRWAAP